MDSNSEESKQQRVAESPSSADDKRPALRESSDDSLDFTSEAPEPESPKQPVIVEYDPRPIEDGARRNIAYALIAILAFLIIAIVELLWSKKINLTDLKEFAVILGPIITLVSAATGFYYGTK